MTSKVSHSFIQPGKVIVAAILLQSAFLTYNAAGATITLTTSDALGNSSFNAAGNWSSASAPSAGNTYSVGAGVTLRTPGTSGNFTFAGDSLTITGASAALMYKGAGNNTITVNDLQLGNGGTFSNGAANTTATLSGTVKLLSGGGIFDAVGDATNTRQLVIAANVTGVGSLSIRSTGTPGGIVTLTGSNNYTGTTTISGSNTRLQLAKEVSLYGGSTASWTSANITINSSCTLGLNVGGVGEFTSADIATLLSLGTSTSGFKNGSFIGLDTTNAPGGSFVYGNVIANTNSGSNVIGLKKFGTNTLILTAANTYTGDTVINSGTLQLGNGTIDGSISSSGNILNNAALVYNVTGNQSYSGIISGSGSLTKLSGGTLILGESNTYSGTTTVSNGTLAFSSVASGTAAQSLGAASAVNLGVAATSSGTLQYTGTTGLLDKSIYAMGNGLNTVKNIGNGLLTLSGSLVKNGTILVLDGGGSGINVTGTISGSNANSDLYITGGTTTLSAVNTYNGPTWVYGGGVLVNGVSNALPTATNVILGGTDNSNGTFDLNGSNQIVAGLSGTGSGAKMVTNNGSATSTLTVSSGGNYAGVIVNGSGTTALTVSGGNLILGGVNTYTGATSITGGTLGVNGSLGTSAVSVSNTATLNGTGTINGAVVSSGTISGGLTFNNSVTLNAGATTSATAFNGDIVNNGTITSTVNLRSGKTLSGSGSVTNTVSGTSATINGSGLTLGATTLYGSSTLSGYNIASSVTVAGGTATLSGTTKSISALSVGVGATLNANGTIDGSATISGLLKGNSSITGNLSLTSGTLSSGNSAGITTVNNDFTMDGNSGLVVEVSGTVAGSSYDQVKVSGNVSLAGTLDLHTLSGLTLGDTITLIENTGSGTTMGYFSTIITSGSTYTVTTSGGTYTFAVGTTEYEINYLANTDAGSAYNDVTLTVVPEPGTWAMLVGGIGMLAFGQRLRRGRE